MHNQCKRKCPWNDWYLFNDTLHQSNTFTCIMKLNLKKDRSSIKNFVSCFCYIHVHACNCNKCTLKLQSFEIGSGVAIFYLRLNFNESPCILSTVQSETKYWDRHSS